MANGDFAIPVGHLARTSAASATTKLEIGRAFLQDAMLDQYSATYTPRYCGGLEIWLDTGAEDYRLFAMCNGEVTYASGGGTAPNRLTLIPSAGAKRAFNSMVGLLEPAPARVVYENTETDATINALAALLRVQHVAAGASAASTWHPAMRQIIDDAGTLKTVKSYFDESSSPDNLTARIAYVAGECVNSGQPIAVNAGDYISDAAVGATYYPATSAFDGFTAARDAVRCVIIRTSEYANNAINPAYYLWRFSYETARADDRSAQIILISKADVKTDNTWDHPLLQALGLQTSHMQMSADPAIKRRILPRGYVSELMPGRTVASDVILWPLGDLGTIHQIVYPAGGSSTVQWKFTDDADLDLYIETTAGAQTADTLAYPTATTNPTLVDAQANITDIWNDWGAAISEICAELQVPVDVVMSLVKLESGGSERIVRLEPLSGNTQLADVKAQVGTPVLEGYVDDYVTLTGGLGGPGRSSLTPPANYATSADVINAVSTLQWQQLIELLSHSAILGSKVSVGLSQTLLSTADGSACARWLERWYGAVDAYAVFGVTALPASRAYADWFDWLLTGRQSLLSGIAYKKQQYCYAGRQGLATAMDLPKVGCAYNAGSLRDDAADVWRMVYYGGSGYPQRVAWYYNVFRDLADANGWDPSIRLFRNGEEPHT